MKNQRRDKYQLQPPDGGWGYLVTAALALAGNVTFIPMGAFGLIYGTFLAEIGNETTATTLANAIFNTVFNFTGLAANNLLQKYSYRFVGVLGACIFFTGHFSIIFVDSIWHMIFSFGFVQGIGMGLMIPAMFTALNSYFDQRLSLMNSIAQSIMVIVSIFIPAIIKGLMDTYGFRGTVAILAALSLHAVLAGVVLQPVQWHMKRSKMPGFTNVLADETRPVQMKPLLDLILEEEECEDLPPRSRTSIISLGDRALSVTTINKLDPEADHRSCWERFVKSLDLDMFKDPTYVSISVGLSLAFTADVAFIAIIPLVLTNAGLDNAQTTLLMTVYFSSDLVARILLAIVSIFCKIGNRHLVLGGAVMSAIFRTAFVMYDTFWWKLINLSILGFLRTFIQTPLPLVLADEYSNDFARAFSLYMVVCGCVSLTVGPLQTMVKSLTGSDVMVVHLLSLGYIICALCWTIEFLLKRRNRSCVKMPRKSSADRDL